MKKALILILLSGLSALFIGCQSSNSNDENNGALVATDVVVDSQCEQDTTQCSPSSNNNVAQPSNPGEPAHSNSASRPTLQCDPVTNGQSIFNTQEQSTCYPTGSDGQYTESPFGFQGGACRCDEGFMPIRRAKGGINCIKINSIVLTGLIATMTFSSGKVTTNNNRKKWRNNTFDLIVNAQGQPIQEIRPAAGNCFNEIPQACNLKRPFKSCKHLNQPGYQATCLPSNASENAQGICVNQATN